MADGLELFTLMAKLSLDKGSYDKDLDDAEQTTKSWSTRMVEAVGAVSGAFTGLLQGIADSKILEELPKWIMGVTKEAAEYGTEIKNSAATIAMSTDAFQEWRYVVEKNGGSGKGFVAAMKAMERGGNSLTKALGTLGIDAEEFDKLSPEDKLAKIVKAFQELDETVTAENRRDLAKAIFGGSYDQMIQTLNLSETELKELRDEFSRFGFLMSDKEIESADKFSSAVEKLNQVWENAKRRIGVAFLDTLGTLIEHLANLIGELVPLLESALKTGKWEPFFAKLKEGIGGLFKGIGMAIGLLNENGELNLPPWLQEVLQTAGMVLGFIFEVVSGIFEFFAGMNDSYREKKILMDVRKQWNENDLGFKDFDVFVQTVKDKYGQRFFIEYENMWRQVLWPEQFGSAYLPGAPTEEPGGEGGEAGDDTQYVYWEREGGDAIKLPPGMDARIAEIMLKAFATIENYNLEDIPNNVAESILWAVRDSVPKELEGTYGDVTMFNPLNNGPASQITIRTNKDVEIEGQKQTQTVEVNLNFGGIQNSVWAQLVDLVFGGVGVQGPDSYAKGLNYVPYDDYLAELHRGEMVLNQNQAREYRQGMSGNSDIVAAINGMRNDLQNLQLVVGQKAFGTAVVDYSGRRMQGFIGQAEDRTISGYGWG